MLKTTTASSLSTSSSNHATSKYIKVAFVCIFLVGALVRVIGVERALYRSSWRESEMASISRNYYREGMNLFYPRVDWRGDGPGYAEMEFPIYPWTMAVLYKLFGVHPVFGRILSFGFSLIALLVFFRLAHYLLPQPGAIGASVLFALSPLVVRIAKSLQPDGLMFLCYVLAAYAFIRWVDDDSWKHYIVALAATAAAILSKAPAAHIGLFFAVLLLYRRGLPALRRARVWFFAIAALLPAVLWYVHARSFWITYGNSLGLSNEYHWAGWDLFTNPSFVLGIGRSELWYVWMPPGVIIALLGAYIWRSERVVAYAFLWLGAIFAYYLVAARTTGDAWAVYYHVVSVPPVALLFGAGVAAIERLMSRQRLLTATTVSSGILAAMLAIVLGVFNLSILGILGISSRKIVTLLVAAIPVVTITSLLIIRWRGRQSVSGGRQSLSLRTLVGYLALVCVPLTFLSQSKVISSDIRPQGTEENLVCAEAFAKLIPENTLILASGGVSKDPTGYPVAINAPYMFYWLDRKGFNIAVEEQSIEAVRSFARRGAKFFVAEKDRLNRKPGFESELRSTFALVGECDAALLFRIAE